jgi:hypothetical protein
MAADIEFNVRNGMTVGADKHMVLNTAGALSASNITITSGGTILSGGQEMTKIIEDINTSTLGEIPNVSADWNSTQTTTNTYSADWQSVASSVNTTSANWNLAHGWGNHASQNYLTDYTVTQGDVTQHQDALHVTTTVSNNSADWETAASWGNHASQNYLTSETTTSLTLANDTLTYTDEAEGSNTISLEAYSTIADATDTGISTPLAGDVLVYVNGSTQQWQNKKDRASLEDMYNYANANFYSELIYTGTQLTGIDVWVNSSRTTKLFERNLTYDTNNNLTQIVTKDVQTTGGSARHTLTKTLAYDTNNNLINITRAFT